MTRSRCVLALLSLFVLPEHPLAAQDPHEKGTFYTVAEYGIDRDPAADLEAAVERAQAEGKRILIQVGGEWCGWCKLLDAFIRDHEAIYDKIEEGFLIMKVNYSRENHNEEFLGKYPTIPGYPHLYVLEKDGTLLYSKNTVELEEGRSYNEQALLDFLDEWMPER